VRWSTSESREKKREKIRRGGANGTTKGTEGLSKEQLRRNGNRRACKLTTENSQKRKEGEGSPPGKELSPSYFWGGGTERKALVNEVVVLSQTSLSLKKKRKGWCEERKEVSVVYHGLKEEGGGN